ncbi:MAG: hypothetical protein JRD89_02115 [Deltaproteobacteria bacterium]|nr:hypothetical protein [Deltaproteobacteria bacterium]
MATKTTRPAAKPNLFARATEKSLDKPKKNKKGTVLQLPRDLNKESELQGESKILNEAITIAIEAKAEMAAAKGRLSAAMGALHEHAEEGWCATYAKHGVQPETPVSLQNHLGQSLTYVVQDKCGQNAIDKEQIELFEILLGEEVAANLVETREAYGFNPDIMKEIAGGKKTKKGETVQDVVFEIVTSAVMENTKLTDEQKAELITSTSKTHLKKNTLPRLAELCGSNVGKLQSFLQAAGSAFVRYLKV